MIELEVSQAKKQFASLLNQSTLVVDKKTHDKKAVILPYEEYKNLLSKLSMKDNSETGFFDKYVGLLDDDFKTTDNKYNEILK